MTISPAQPTHFGESIIVNINKNNTPNDAAPPETESLVEDALKILHGANNGTLTITGLVNTTKLVGTLNGVVESDQALILTGPEAHIADRLFRAGDWMGLRQLWDLAREKERNGSHKGNSNPFNTLDFDAEEGPDGLSVELGGLLNLEV